MTPEALLVEDAGCMPARAATMLRSGRSTSGRATELVLDAWPPMREARCLSRCRRHACRLGTDTGRSRGADIPPFRVWAGGTGGDGWVGGAGSCAAMRRRGLPSSRRKHHPSGGRSHVCRRSCRAFDSAPGTCLRRTGCAGRSRCRDGVSSRASSLGSGMRLTGLGETDARSSGRRSRCESSAVMVSELRRWRRRRSPRKPRWLLLPEALSLSRYV